MSDQQSPLTAPMNPLVLERILLFGSSPSHAVLFTGSLGMGHHAAADQLVQVLPRTEQYVTLSITPQDKQHISIDAVRELRSTLKHKTNDQANINRIVIIDSIDNMLGEAQNALLKLLEEPPRGVLFIVFNYEPETLLPTIASRCVAIQLLPISTEQASNHYGDNYHVAAYHMSGGQPELLHALHMQDDHPLTRAIAQAKMLLSQDQFERLCIVDTLAKQKEQANMLIDALYRLCSAGLRSSNQKTAWLKRLRTIQKAKKRIKHNVQLKLVLTEMFLGL